MVRLQNNKGIALVTSLLFTLISLGIIMALLTIVLQGTRISAANKLYRSATEAGYGAVDVVSRDIMPAIFKGSLDTGYISGLTNAIILTFPSVPTSPPPTAPSNCIDQKLGLSTLQWTNCTGQYSSPNPKQSPDMTFTLNAVNNQVGFNVFAKIIDTRCGGDTAAGQPCSNSDNSGVD